jgi:hypothetical protein
MEKERLDGVTHLHFIFPTQQHMSSAEDIAKLQLSVSDYVDTVDELQLNADELLGMTAPARALVTDLQTAMAALGHTHVGFADASDKVYDAEVHLAATYNSYRKTLSKCRLMTVGLVALKGQLALMTAAHEAVTGK